MEGRYTYPDLEKDARELKTILMAVHYCHAKAPHKLDIKLSAMTKIVDTTVQHSVTAARVFKAMEKKMAIIQKSNDSQNKKIGFNYKQVSSCKCSATSIINFPPTPAMPCKPAATPCKPSAMPCKTLATPSKLLL